MALRDQCSLEEWAVLCTAPLAAALYVAQSSGGRLQLMREILALQRRVVSEEARGEGPLAEEVLASITDGEDGVALELSPEDPEAVLAIVERAGHIAAKLGDERFKVWLMHWARAGAEAAKDGGLLGIGGVRVSPEEEAAMSTLAERLGANA